MVADGLVASQKYPAAIGEGVGENVDFANRRLVQPDAARIADETVPLHHALFQTPDECGVATR